MVEQKIHKLKKKRISKLKGIKSKAKVIMPTMLIKNSTDNMNQTESEKYGYAPNQIEKKSFLSKKLEIVFNFEWIKKAK